MREQWVKFYGPTYHWGYEYYISTKGRIRRRAKDGGYVYRKPCISSTGYGEFISYENKHIKRWKIHRLVAKIYIPNPDNKPQVNHINGNKLDNRVENLEWVNNAENQWHSRDVLGHGVCPIKEVGTNNAYRSIKEAAKEKSLCYQSLCRALTNNKPIKGLYFVKCKK